MAQDTDALLDKLVHHVDEVGSRFPVYEVDDHFLLWFLRAYLVESDDDAKAALTGAPGDKHVDASVIDGTSHLAFIIQSKYRSSPASGYESRGEMEAFRDVARVVTGELEQFNQFTADMDPRAEEHLKQVRKYVLQHGYGLRLLYVTLNKVGRKTAREIRKSLRPLKEDARLDILDARRCAQLYEDYLDGVAPPVPFVDLQFEARSRVRSEGSFYRQDLELEIETWVFSMSGDAIARLYDEWGRRLFARNIRGFLGDRTKVNKDIQTTIEEEPEYFWYFNNGITIICDEAEQTKHQGVDILQVRGPQIINGQQTTRELHAKDSEADDVSVLVRVIKVGRLESHGELDYRDLVERIVRATNWQNKISEPDLRSNDAIQVRLEREMKKISHHYLRKRKSKAEVKATTIKGFEVVKMIDVAYAVAVCRIDPNAVGSLGKNQLFSDDYYHRVFPSKDPFYYLTRYWVGKRVRSHARGRAVGTHAKWLVLHFLWQDVGDILQSAPREREFVRASRVDTDYLSILDEQISRVMRQAEAMYRANNRTKDGDEVSPQSFFKRSGLADMMSDHWHRSENRSRDAYRRDWGSLREALDTAAGI